MSNEKKIADILNSIPQTKDILSKEDFSDFSTLVDDPDFVAEYLKAKIVEDVLSVMEDRNLNQNQLAKLLGKSRQYVNHILNEQVNFTIRKIAELACALGCKANIQIKKVDHNEYQIYSSEPQEKVFLQVIYGQGKPCAQQPEYIVETGSGLLAIQKSEKGKNELQQNPA